MLKILHQALHVMWIVRNRQRDWYKQVQEGKNLFIRYVDVDTNLDIDIEILSEMFESSYSYKWRLMYLTRLSIKTLLSFFLSNRFLVSSKSWAVKVGPNKNSFTTLTLTTQYTYTCGLVRAPWLVFHVKMEALNYIFKVALDTIMIDSTEKAWLICYYNMECIQALYLQLHN